MPQIARGCGWIMGHSRVLLCTTRSGGGSGDGDGIR
jgi:hypothetical protein